MSGSAFDTRAIQVGDLVQVVYSHCDHKLGAVGIVDGFYKGRKWAMDRLRCDLCKADVTPLDMTTATVGSDAWPLAWLRRIPPLSELEGERTEEQLKEPA